MLCLRCTKFARDAFSPPLASYAAKTSNMKPAAARTFTSLRGPSRPSIFPSCAAFRPSIPAPSLTNPGATREALDLLPKISTHPALGSIQIRCGPRNTFSPSHFVRKRRHGFLSRLRTRKGRALLQRRKSKGRANLSH